MKKYSMFIIIFALLFILNIMVLNICASTISNSTDVNNNTASTDLSFLYAALNPDTIINTMQLNTRRVSEITTTEGAELDLIVYPYIWTQSGLNEIARLASGYKVIETLEEPSWIYNCHSYAWYLDNSGNEYWICSPKPFIDDVHCIWITDEDDVVPGDIAVYYEETNGVYDYKHSAIVYDIYDEDGETVVILDSKWGSWGAYRHYLKSVPDEYISDADSDGKPDVLYYRYTQDEHYLSEIIEDNGVNGHTIKCDANKTVNNVHKTCSYTTECYSTPIYTSYNSSKHFVSCPDCGCSGYSDHDLYMYSAAPEDYVVKCHDCTYTVECWESPEYYGNSEDGHWVDCACGCYSFFEPHTPGSYSSTEEGYHNVVCADCGYVYTEDCNYGSAEAGNSSYHFYECTDCGYEHYEYHVFTYSQILNDNFVHNAYCSVCQTPYEKPHNWVSVSGGYRCSDCRMPTSIIPDYSSLSDEELSLLLSSMSEEEIEQFIALLPEDAVARVTAILPPDDEFVTE